MIPTLFFLLFVSASIFLIYKVIKRNKEILNTSTSTSKLDFFDELRNHIRYIVGDEKIDYAGGVTYRALMFYYISNKDKWMDLIIDCSHIEIRFHLVKYADGRRNIKINVTSHYGQCTWDGRTMHYNYPMANKEFECDVNDFKNTWNKVLEYCYKVK